MIASKNSSSARSSGNRNTSEGLSSNRPPAGSGESGENNGARHAGGSSVVSRASENRGVRGADGSRDRGREGVQEPEDRVDIREGGQESEVSSSLLDGLSSAYGEDAETGATTKPTEETPDVEEADASPSGEPTGEWTESGGGIASRPYVDADGQPRVEFRNGENHWSSPAGGGLYAVEDAAMAEGTTTLTLEQSEGLHGECAPQFENGYDGTIDVHGEMSEEQQAALQAALEAIPDEARDHIGEIVLSDDLGVIHTPNGDVPVGGLGGNGTVYLNRTQLETPGLARHILTHELGHNADRALGLPSDGALFEDGTQAVTVYGASNPAERYAETTRFALENLELYQNGQAPVGGSIGGDWDGDVAPDPGQALVALETLGVDPDCYSVPILELPLAG